MFCAGNDGDFYIDLATTVLYGPRTGGSWPASGISLVGPQGAPGSPGTNGTDGNTVLNGTGSPADVIVITGSDFGSDGDFYIDTAANVIYGPKSGGAWPASGTSLVGPQGATGTFTGAFASPDGHYSLSVTDAGIVMSGPLGSVTINGNGVTINGDSAVTITGPSVSVDSPAQVSVHAGNLTMGTTGSVTITGAQIGFNGSCSPLAREGDLVDTSGSPGTISTGSATVSSC